MSPSAKKVPDQVTPICPACGAGTCRRLPRSGGFVVTLVAAVAAVAGIVLIGVEAHRRQWSQGAVEAWAIGICWLAGTAVVLFKMSGARSFHCRACHAKFRYQRTR